MRTFIIIVVMIYGCSASAQTFQNGIIQQTVSPTYYATVASLPTAAADGTVAYAKNCRAISGVAGLNAGLSTQAAGAGTGCIVSYSAASAAWQVAGTTVTAAQ